MVSVLVSIMINKNYELHKLFSFLNGNKTICFNDYNLLGSINTYYLLKDGNKSTNKSLSSSLSISPLPSCKTEHFTMINHFSINVFRNDYLWSFIDRILSAKLYFIFCFNKMNVYCIKAIRILKYFNILLD